jgi:hypothetical protein
MFAMSKTPLTLAGGVLHQFGNKLWSARAIAEIFPLAE